MEQQRGRLDAPVDEPSSRPLSHTAPIVSPDQPSSAATPIVSQDKPSSAATPIVSQDKPSSAATPIVSTDQPSSVIAPIVSLVVPMYNVREYLDECLLSILSQDLAPIQVILVDDGSTDGTAQIAQGYADAYPQVEYHRIPNQGLGHARNYGARLAHGTWLMFPDSDDTLAPHALRDLVALGEKHDCELVTGDVVRFNAAHEWPNALQRTAFRNVPERCHVSTHPSLLYDHTAWNKLFRRDFFEHEGLQWVEGHLYEDMPCSTPAHVLASRVAYLNQVVYRWRERDGGSPSITQRRTEIANFRDRMHAIALVDQFFASHEVPAALALAKDAKWLTLDIPIYLDVLPEATDDYRNEVVQAVADYLAGIDPRAWAMAPSAERIKCRLAARRDVQGLVDFVRWCREASDTLRVTRKGGRLYGAYPVKGLAKTDTDMTDELANGGLYTDVKSVAIDGDTWSVEASVLLPRLSQRKVSLVASLMDASGNAALPLQVTPHPSRRAVEIRASKAHRSSAVRWQPLRDFTLTASRGELASLAPGAYRVSLTYADAGFLCEPTPLAHPIGGEGARPRPVRIEQSVLAITYGPGEELTLLVREDRNPVVDVRLVGDELCLSRQDGSIERVPLTRSKAFTSENDNEDVDGAATDSDGDGLGASESEASHASQPEQESAPPRHTGDQAAGKGRTSQRVDAAPVQTEGHEPKQAYARNDEPRLLELDDVPFAGASRLIVCEGAFGREEPWLVSARQEGTLQVQPIAPSVTAHGCSVDGSTIQLTLGWPYASALPEHATAWLVGSEFGAKVALMLAPSEDGRSWAASINLADHASSGLLRDDSYRILVETPREPHSYEVVLAQLTHAEMSSEHSKLREEQALTQRETIGGHNPTASEAQSSSNTDVPASSTSPASIADTSPAGGTHVIHEAGFTYTLDLRGRKPLLTVTHDRAWDEGCLRQMTVERTLYPLMRRLPLQKNLVLFESFWATSVGCSPKALYDYIEAHHPEYQCVWSVRDERIPVGGRAKVVRQGSFEYYQALARATYLVNNVNFPDYYVKRPGQIEVQTMHGTPLKTMGIDVRDEVPNDEVAQRFLRTCSRWDYLVVQSKRVEQITARCFGFAKSFLRTGYPRNDALLKRNTPQEQRQIKQRMGADPDKKLVVYAPTWRARGRFDLRLDLARLQERLGEHYEFALRRHYMAVPRMSGEELLGSAIDLTYGWSVDDVMLAADVIVTDYSSIMFDYALLDRPMIFYVYDLESYRDDLRGFNLDFEDEAPGPLLRTTDQVAEALGDLDAMREQYHNKYQAFVQGFLEYESDHSSEDVFRRVFES